MCGCQCDDSELGEVLINPQPVPVFQVWRAGVTLIKFGDVRKQVCSEEVQGLRGRWGSFWGRAPHMSTPPGHASAGHIAVSMSFTFPSLTPLAGISTFSMAAETTCRGREHEQRVRWRALEGRDPPTIIPNHPLHAALAARTPSASAHSHCSFAA